MLKKILLCYCVLSIFACSTLTGEDGIFRDRKYDYKKSEMTPRMEIPENLDNEAIVDYYVIPKISPYAEQEIFETVPLPTDMIGQAGTAVKIQKMGDVHWVLLQIPASQVWPRLKEFISQQSLSISIESSRLGMIEASKPDAIYRFQVAQGFQRNTSELAIRFLFTSADTPGFWPESSSDAAREYAMLEQLAQFFAEVSDKPAYSFAAQGISTQQKVLVETLADGTRILLLNVTQQRALATVKQALERAGFTIDHIEGSTYTVQYTPPVAEGDQPGFLARLIGFKRKPYDKDMEYAGNNYSFSVTEQQGMYRVQVVAIDSPVDDITILRKELNKQLLLVKGHLY